MRDKYEVSPRYVATNAVVTAEAVRFKESVGGIDEIQVVGVDVRVVLVTRKEQAL